MIYVGGSLLPHWNASTGGASFLSFHRAVAALVIAFMIWLLLNGWREWSTGEITAFAFGLIIFRTAVVVGVMGIIFGTLLTSGVTGLNLTF